MIKFFLLCTLLSLIYSSGHSQKNNKNKKDTTYYKATLVPLKVTQPTLTTRDLSKDSSYLNLSISKDSIVVELLNHSTSFDGGSSLDKFLVDNKKRIDKTKVLIINEKDGSVEKFKEVTEVLRKNGITKFNLITR